MFKVSRRYPWNVLTTQLGKLVSPSTDLMRRAHSLRQYQAGVGNDPRASRQFNPIKQAADYDPQAEYVRMWLPELKDVPLDYVQTPWSESRICNDVY